MDASVSTINAPDGRVSYFDASNESDILEMEVLRFGWKIDISRTLPMLRIGKQVVNGKMSSSTYTLKVPKFGWNSVMRGVENGFNGNAASFQWKSVTNRMC